MRKIGFIKSKKENEFRRALTYEDLINFQNKKMLYFEKGYFKEYGYSDEEINELGCNILDYSKIIEKCDVLIDPKIGDSEDLNKFKNKIIFGWIHATQNYDITQNIIDSGSSAIAFEKMFENNIHSFYKNNELAGLAAIYHSMLQYGKKYTNLKAAILGNGNTSKGAVEALKSLGAEVTIYKRNEEDKFKEEMFNYDILVNAVLWDTNRKDHIIYEKDLKKLKKGAIIIDISCDKKGAVETSVPTTIENPVYTIDGIMHYVVDHTPTLLYKEATASISNVVFRYLDNLINSKDLEAIFGKAVIIKNGIIIDEEINIFQRRG